MVRANLSAAASGNGPGALMLVVGAILFLASLACFRGVDFLHWMGAEKVGDTGCWVTGIIGVGLIIAAIVYFFRKH